MSTIQAEVENDGRSTIDKADKARRLNGRTDSQRFLFYAPPSASWEQLRNWWSRLKAEGLVE